MVTARKKNRRGASSAAAKKSAGAGPIELWIRVTLPGLAHIGPGKAELLRQIRECQSISGAARAMKMSYRRAWLLVEEMNKAFRQPVVVKWLGGRSAGGATLTPTGEKVVAIYERVVAQAESANRALLDELATIAARRS